MNDSVRGNSGSITLSWVSLAFLTCAIVSLVLNGVLRDVGPVGPFIPLSFYPWARPLSRRSLPASICRARWFLYHLGFTCWLYSSSLSKLYRR